MKTHVTHVDLMVLIRKLALFKGDPDPLIIRAKLVNKPMFSFHRLDHHSCDAVPMMRHPCT